MAHVAGHGFLLSYDNIIIQVIGKRYIDFHIAETARLRVALTCKGRTLINVMMSAILFLDSAVPTL